MEIATRAVDEADFPGYAEAAARENFVRALACMGMPEFICGLPVQALTPWHIRWLALTKSPFLISGITVEQLATKPGIVDDVINFMWIVSPVFKPGAITSGRLKKILWPSRRDVFNRRYAGLMELPLDKVCAATLNYVEEAHIDAGENSGGDNRSYYDFHVGIAEEMHECYGFSIAIWRPRHWLARGLERVGLMLPDSTRVPLKIIFQLRKCRLQRGDPKAVLTNASEKLITLGLVEQTRQQRCAIHQFQYEQELKAWKPGDVSKIPPAVNVDYSAN